MRAKNINRLIDEKVCLEEQGGDEMSDHIGNHGPGDGDGPGDDEGPGDGVAPGDVQRVTSSWSVAKKGEKRIIAVKCVSILVKWSDDQSKYAK